MKVYAVIAEFNPFHNGHAHLIRSLKEKEDCAVVAIMSGSFVERGDVAVIDKYARAEAAVKCGCDLAIELPAPWCFSGAEFFALGGVGVADGLGVVDSLAFGSESGNIRALSDSADRLSSTEFAAAMARERKNSPDKNTAVLRSEVYASLYGESTVFNGSNNLLALEYIHALRTLDSNIIPVTVKRIGGDFNSDELGGLCSASAIRSAISRDVTDFSAFMPSESENLLRRELEAGRIYRLSHLNKPIIAMLRAIPPVRFRGCMEVSGGIEHRLHAEANGLVTVAELVDAVKNKRYSPSRIRRALLSMMLGVRMADVETPPQFTVVLAANGRGREVLGMARKFADIAILSKISDGQRLTGDAARQFSLHMRAERLAELCCDGEPRRVGAVMV